MKILLRDVVLAVKLGMAAVGLVCAQGAEKKFIDYGVGFDEAFVREVSPAVVWIYNADTQGTGTGVALFPDQNAPADAKAFEALVATNFHVIRSSTNRIVVWVLDDSGVPFPARGNYWHGNPQIDLAFLKLGKIRGALAGNEIPGKAIGWSMLPRQNKSIRVSSFATRNISRGDSLIFLGYPLNFGVRLAGIASAKDLDLNLQIPIPAQRVPVVRFGHVAYEDGGAHYLIDASNSPGNSGSPVFLSTYRDGSAQYGFAGLVTGYIEQESSILLGGTGPVKTNHFNLHDGTTVQIKQNSGLSIVISPAAIAKELEEGIRLKASHH